MHRDPNHRSIELERERESSNCTFNTNLFEKYKGKYTGIEISL